MTTAATTTAALALVLAAGWVTGARTRAWGAALHPWEDQRWPLVRISAPTLLILRSAVAVRSLVTQA